MIFRVRPLSSEVCHYTNKKQIHHLTYHIGAILFINNLSLDELRLEMVKKDRHTGHAFHPSLGGRGRETRNLRPFLLYHKVRSSLGYISPYIKKPKMYILCTTFPPESNQV